MSLKRLRDYRIWDYPVILLLLAAGLSVVGVLVIRSATIGTADADLYQRQIMGLSISAGMAVIFSLVDYHLYKKLFPVIWFINVAILAYVLIAGVVRGGARRWIILPAIGQIQPSEFCKIMLVVFWASLMSVLERDINKAWAVGIIVGTTAVPLFLIFREPDISTTIVCVLLFAAMIYTAKISYKWILGVLGVIVPAAGAFFWYLFANEQELVEEHYWARRILAFFRPQQYADLYYQQENSMMAIGSGGLAGKGLYTTTFESVKNGNFLSEAQTDFVFAVVGEELGFLGAAGILCGVLLLIILCLNVGRRAPDMCGRLLCTGYAALIGFQTIVNISVATGMMPNTGIPLPFISFGTSSLLSAFVGLGIVLNVGLQRKKKEKDDWRVV